MKVAQVSEVPRNQMKVFQVEDRGILVINIEDMFYAVEDRCPHMDYPLYLGSLEEKIITCGFHYAQFDISMGKALRPPANKPLKAFNVKGSKLNGFS